MKVKCRICGKTMEIVRRDDGMVQLECKKDKMYRYIVELSKGV